MVEELFNVATEFRFDVGQALINTQSLTQAVDDLSKSANSALNSLNYLAGGLVAHLGFGSGGLLSLLSQSVKIYEQFNAESLNFANNIGTNFRLLTGTIGTFNDRLKTSEMLMENVQRAAIKTGLPAADLANITRLLATPLAQHGKLGTNYEGGINLAKSLMLSSEAVGMHPMVAAETLSRALTDKMPIHGALFARLVNTEAFRNQRVMTQQQLINMRPDVKIDLLTKALNQLGGDAQFIANRLNRLSVQFQILKDQVEVLLRPIGEAFARPIRIMLKAANDYLRSNGEKLGKNIGEFLSTIVGDPQKLFINLMQLKNVGKDFKEALHLTELLQLFLFIKFILGKLGIELGGGLLKRGLQFLLEGLGSAIKFLWNLGIFQKVFTLLRMALVEVLPPFLAFFGILQIISRARAIAKLDNVKNMLDLTPKISEVLLRLKVAFENIFLPITMVIDFFARLISPLFETSTYLNILVPILDGIADVLERIGQVVVYALAGLNAFINALVNFGFDLAEGKNPLTNILANMRHGFSDFLSQHPITRGDNNTSKSVVYNSNHIEARFDMREQLEPDRIAFAVTTHLKKLAISAVGARGDHLQAAFAGNQLEAGR